MEIKFTTTLRNCQTARIIKTIQPALTLLAYPRRFNFQTHLSHQATYNSIMSDSNSIINDADLLQVLSCIDSLRETSLSILALHSELPQISSPSASPTPAEIETSRLQSRLFAYSAQLKSLHRKAIMSVRATKQLTSDARSEIDRLNLQLQNLVYEQRHLRGEIRGCEEYEYVFLPSILLHRFRYHKAFSFLDQA